MAADLEVEALLEADGPEDARRILDERQIVQNADRPFLEIPPSAEEVEELAEFALTQPDCERVDREVAAVEVLLDGR